MPVTRHTRNAAMRNKATIDLESRSSRFDDVSVDPGRVLLGNGSSLESAASSRSRRSTGYGSKVVDVEVASTADWLREMKSKPVDTCPSVTPIVETSSQLSSPEAPEYDHLDRVREVVEVEGIPAPQPENVAAVAAFQADPSDRVREVVEAKGIPAPEPEDVAAVAAFPPDTKKPSRTERLSDRRSHVKRAKRGPSPPSDEMEASPLPVVPPTSTTMAQIGLEPPSSATDELEEAGDPTAPLVCPPAPFHVLEDPNEYYVEEEAHLYHNPPLPSKVTQGVRPQDLAPLKPPPPPPTPPETGKCSWSYDDENRIFLADFRAHDGPMDPIDTRFMLEVMERDDLTLISDGLLDMMRLDRKLWTMENIAGTFLDEFYHKFRRFDSTTNTVVEIDHLHSMRMSDYCAYLEKRAKFLAGIEHEGPYFSFEDHQGKEHKLDVSVSALYCIDLDIKKNLKELYDDFLANFRMLSILPGGHHCLMNKVTEDARPFMGPNCTFIVLLCNHDMPAHPSPHVHFSIYYTDWNLYSLSSGRPWNCRLGPPGDIWV